MFSEIRLWRVTFHWLRKENGSIDVLAKNVDDAITFALEIEQKSGSSYRHTNIIKVEQIGWPQEKDKE